MFEDSLVESTRHISKRRGWMTVLSTSIQIVFVAVLVILPLLRTSAISLRPNSIPVVGPYPKQPIVEAHRNVGSADSTSIAPPAIRVARTLGHMSLRDPGAIGEPVAQPVQICLSDCRIGLNVPYAIGNSAENVILKKPEQRRPPVISQFDPGQIVRRVEPLYPPLARTARIHGMVVMHAIISREGAIERLQVVRSDHPMLNRAALDAVSQWRFKPYILNREPIEVETEITVNFTLDGAR